MQLVKNLIYNLLSIQEHLLKNRLSKTLDAKQLSKRKRHYGKGCVLDLNSLADAEKQKLEDELYGILNTYNYEPKDILKYIESQGTKVYFQDGAAKLLNPIGENEGFIYPAKGFKALYLSCGIMKKFALKTDEMFILSNGEINKYYFIYYFYNWYAYKHNIAGMEPESQELLKKYLFSDAKTESLQLSEIYKLKDAIRQDKASIEFVIKLCRNYEGAKQALGKMNREGSAKL